MPVSFLLPDLALLASQHHRSEYNRTKFGPQGCPVKYTPLSFHVPDTFNELQQRQLRSAPTKPWWLCSRPDCPPSKGVVVLGPSGAHAADTTLQQELLAAIGEPLSLVPDFSASEKNFCKTSRSHPLNVSFIVPPDLLSLISSQLSANHTSINAPPTVFDLPPSFTIDQLTEVYRQDRSSKPTKRAPPPPPVTQEFLSACPKLSSRSTIADALRIALSSDLGSLPFNSKSPANAAHPLPSDTTKWILSRSIQCDDVTSKKQPPSVQGASYPLTISTTPNAEQLDSASVTEGFKSLDDGWNSFSLLHYPSQRDDIWYPSNSSSPTTPVPPFQLGNLFLSSCPGKKVRLQGPVKGRQGVCRDLEADLQRIKGLGVGCLVCCLDDGELEFLGSPWPKYQETAKNLGMDVLRIPMPEGLAPTAPALVDAHLNRLISQYTLRGTPVLVHCRGGVGRAGVIACCWLIKLGLCGWVSEEAGELDQDLVNLIDKDDIFRHTPEFAREFDKLAREGRRHEVNLTVGGTMKAPSGEKEADQRNALSELAKPAQIRTLVLDPYNAIVDTDVPTQQPTEQVDIDSLNPFIECTASDAPTPACTMTHNQLDTRDINGVANVTIPIVGVTTLAASTTNAHCAINEGDGIDPNSHDSSTSAHPEPTATHNPLVHMVAMGCPVRNEVVSFVKRVIEVVRKRRSIKAVETYEQVRFLVEYVEYLREGKGERVDLSNLVVMVWPGGD